MNRIEDIGYGSTLPLELIELTEGKRSETGEVDFLYKLVGAIKGKRLIDLCAGTGRLSIELIKRQARVFALEGSYGMIELIKKRCNDLPYDVASNLNLVIGDVCEIDYPKDIDAIIITDGSIGYFFHGKDLSKVLYSSFLSLNNGGILVLHLFNSKIRMKKDLVNKVRIRSEYHDERTKNHIIQYRHSVLDDKKGIVETIYENMFFYDEHLRWKQDSMMRYKLFSVDEVIQVAADVGLTLSQVYGSYSMEPVSKNSDYILVFFK